VVDELGRVLVGELIVRAARELQLPEIPVVDVHGLSEAEQEAMAVAYARLLETGSFDNTKLGALLARLEVEIPDLDFGDLGLEVAEVDLAFATLGQDASEERPRPPGPAVARIGDLFRLGRHRLLVGDATSVPAIARLLNGRAAGMAFADVPYNLQIDGFVSKRGTKREFVAASGEMSSSEFIKFLGDFMATACQFSSPSALHFICIDWRHMREPMEAAGSHYNAMLNVCVWVKDRPGQGSHWRSQHEMIFVYRVGKARHLNNVQLGRYGRARSNVWQYPAASSFLKSDPQAELVGGHPTPKNKAMVADAILDCTRRGDIVLDPFLGSGTTLIACEDTSRDCYGMDLDPLYADLSVRRWEAWTGASAVHDESGLTFAELAVARSGEEAVDRRRR
jgi:DNA modification methylase